MRASGSHGIRYAMRVCTCSMLPNIHLALVGQAGAGPGTSRDPHASSVKAKQSTATEIDISISWPMDATIYDLPLTLKVEVPSGWRDARVTADGKEVSAKALNQNGETEILIDVLPNTKAVHVEKKASST